MTREELAAIRRRLTVAIVPTSGAPTSAIDDALRAGGLSPHAAALLAFADNRLRHGSVVPDWIAIELRCAAEQRDREVEEALLGRPWLHRG
jgi:hypothetical protein